VGNLQHKQPFQNQLSIDLASAFISFAEATYSHPNSSKWDKLRIMAALRCKIVTLFGFPDRNSERKELSNKLLLLVEQTKKELKMSRWIHMPQNSAE
jgi:hypothetical protein